ncbi:HMG-box domain, partial [Rhizoctonia solani]
MSCIRSTLDIRSPFASAPILPPHLREPAAVFRRIRMDSLPSSSTWPTSSDDGPSLAARAFANFDWSSPTAMLESDIHTFATPTTPENMIFPIDDMLDQPPQAPAQAQYPRTGTLDSWDEALSAYTHVDQLTFDEPDLDNQGGSFCLSDPNSFSGTPSSWDVGSGISIEPPLTPDSPPYHGDSFGVSPGQLAPFSPSNPLVSSFPGEHIFTVGQPSPIRTRPTGRVPIRRTNTHTHSHSFSSQLRGSTIHSPQPRPTLHMRAMSHSAAMHSRPTNLTMSPRTLRNSTLDAALAQPDSQLHFHHVIATPFSSSAPSDPAPIAGNLRRSLTPGDEKTLSAGEDDASSNRKASPEQSADLVPPTRSRLNPPKQAPSTWQIFFTEYLQNYKATNPERKLNVSQAAKDGGAAYKALSPQQKEIYKRKARLAKQEYDRELAAWQRMLTPEDIRVENAFRSAQRKAGKSRRSNLKDPNAPKKPLSAYFMFLQWIRADPARIQDVFGDETETTRQSVLAASKWRELSDAEKKPFLAQAEREKLEYEAARKVYEERTSGISKSNPYTGGFMHMTGTTVTSNSWGTSADAEVGGRRGSSSSGKLPGGASFGAIMFSPTSTYDEEAVADGDMEDMLNTIHWK